MVQYLIAAQVSLQIILSVVENVSSMMVGFCLSCPNFDTISVNLVVKENNPGFWQLSCSDSLFANLTFFVRLICIRIRYCLMS